MNIVGTFGGVLFLTPENTLKFVFISNILNHQQNNQYKISDLCKSEEDNVMLCCIITFFSHLTQSQLLQHLCDVIFVIYNKNNQDEISDLLYYLFFSNDYLNISDFYNKSEHEKKIFLIDFTNNMRKVLTTIFSKNIKKSTILKKITYKQLKSYLYHFLKYYNNTDTNNNIIITKTDKKNDESYVSILNKLLNKL